MEVVEEEEEVLFGAAAGALAAAAAGVALELLLRKRVFEGSRSISFSVRVACLILSLFIIFSLIPPVFLPDKEQELLLCTHTHTP